MIKRLLLSLILLLLAFLLLGKAYAAPPVQEGELAVITSPTNNAIVRGVVDIRGSAAHPQFQFYKLEFALEPVQDNWSIIGAITETPVTDGVLGTWDTTALPDGSYSLRLQVVRVDGNFSEYEVRQVVVANTLPTETPTTEGTPTSTKQPAGPTFTPTPGEPTPTVVIEMPAADTPTPRPIPTGETPIPTPPSDEGFKLNISIDYKPFQKAFCYGGGVTLGVFLLFGIMMMLRDLIRYLINRRL